VNFNRIALGCGLLVATAWTTPAFAQFVPGNTVLMDYVGMATPTRQVKFVRNAPDGATTVDAVGPYRFTYPHTTPILGLGAEEFYLFCVDIDHNLPHPPPGLATYSVKEFDDYTMYVDHPVYGASAGANARTYLERLYGYVFGGVFKPTLTSYDPLALTADERVAFQVSVWELSHDNNQSVSRASGQNFGFWYTGGTNFATIKGIAQGFLDVIKSPTYSGPTIELLVLDSADHQDQLVPIPEPATWAALLGGVTLLAVVLRRARRDRQRA
jgi:hypothetical protein